MKQYQQLHLAAYSKEKGATFVEYVLLAAVLVPAFFLVSLGIYDVTRFRTESNIGSTSLPSPCIPMRHTNGPNSGNLVRPTDNVGMCLPFRLDYCTTPGSPEYQKFCFCCYP